MKVAHIFLIVELRSLLIIIVSSENQKLTSKHLSENDDELDNNFSVCKNHDDYSCNDDLSYDVNIDEE